MFFRRNIFLHCDSAKVFRTGYFVGYNEKKMIDIHIFRGIRGFDWDQFNKYKSKIKHNVSVTEAEDVFEDLNIKVVFDEKHSNEEKRYTLQGVTSEGRLLTVNFTIRGDKIRIISARGQSRKERRQYEKKT